MGTLPADTTSRDGAGTRDAVMRAIAARERKRATAERREAQKAHEAARDAPQAVSAGWSTKPAPGTSRRRKRAAAEVATPATAARVAWAKRHPDAAKAERGLRKSRAETLANFAHKNAGTPETHAHAERRNQGSLARLWESGAIDADQLAWAVEIALAAERIGADVAVRTASLEARVDETRRGDGSFFEKLGQVQREVAYTKWRSTLVERGAPIAAVLEMLTGEPVGFTVVARRYGMHNRRAKRLLIDAIDLWPRILYQVRRDIDEQSLAAAQAGIRG